MRRPALAFILLAVLPTTLRGQTGSGSTCCQRITPRVQAGLMTLSEGAGLARHQWIQAIVLWRTAGERANSSSAASADAFEQMAGSARSGSLVRGRQRLGGVGTSGYPFAEYDREHLWMLDREFTLPRRDSALVVMVDDGGMGGRPRVAGHAYIPAEMPESYWMKTWSSGDTTFMVRSRHAEELLVEALRASSDVRAFLDAAPAH